LKAAIYEGSNKISIRDVVKPVLSINEVLIQVKYGGICGSDLFVTSGRHPRIKPQTIIGHEFSGEIVKIKSKNKNIDLNVGDRVATKPTISCGHCEACEQGLYHVCRNLRFLGVDFDGGFAEYVKVPIENIIKVSNKVPYEEIALVEPLAVAVHAVRRSNFKVGDEAIILGGGPIGLLIASVLKISGASKIMISEINPFRLKMIENLGFIPINPIKEEIETVVQNLTRGKGADILFEAVGIPTTSKQLVKLTKIHGEIVIVGMFKEPTKVDLQELGFKEQRITGIRVYTKEDFKKAVKLIENKKINVKSFITHKLKLSEVEKGMEMMRNKSDSLKILLSL